MKFKTFIGPWNIPVQHAMTIGELSQMFNTEMNIHHPNLTVIKLLYPPDAFPRDPQNYNNARWCVKEFVCCDFSNFIKLACFLFIRLLPSPNLPTLLSGFLYPGAVMVEAFFKVSLGRGILFECS
jgi:uncharacterized protein YbbC (DUF1343 family)